jgi:flagellar basal-body rod protein FlgB
MVLFSPLMAFTEKMLDVTTSRHKVISNNISNINTPGFTGSEVSFKDALERIQQTANDDEGPDVTEEMKTRNINEQLLQNLNIDHLYLEGQQYETDLGVGHSLASTKFEHMFKQQVPGIDLDPRAQADKALSRSEQIAAVQPRIEESKGTPRQDGNNVSPEIEMSKMIKNTSFYNVLVSSISGEFRTFKTIISNR